ncbi:hypothetical protein V2J09_017645, partial [Rumex salicifolius]
FSTTRTGKEDKELWHRRFGHLNSQALLKLERLHMVKGLPELKSGTRGDDVCSVSLVGKQHKKPFPRRSTCQATSKLQLRRGVPITEFSSSSQQLTLQQNAVAEQKNRTLLNVVRCMLADTKVPNSFWCEAVAWSTYVLNRSPMLELHRSLVF